MAIEKNLKWQNPLQLAKRIAANYTKNDWVFLYSALHQTRPSSTSYIALFPQKKIVSEDFSQVKNTLKNNSQKWFGYLSYELGRQFENLPKTKKSFIDSPQIYLVNFALVLKFDHQKKKLTATFSKKENLDEVLKYKLCKRIAFETKVENLRSNFSDSSYLKTIASIKKMIARGDFFQTNLTRKFFGKFSQQRKQKENFELFCSLTKLSPANYSSFLKLGENFVISSSPELFLEIKNRKIFTRPIKGTSARSSSKEQDKKNKDQLKNSTKERAENLMIVDLMRNDLSKICEPKSIEVNKLFAVTTYKNIHHMSSEIRGKIAKNFSAVDAFAACFPAGSMTGTPKVKAMEIAAKKEKLNRGIYSGAIGFFSGRNEANFAVTIRTLITQKNKFEFQVGGAITFDSKPQEELQETFNKAKAIMEILGKNKLQQLLKNFENDKT